MEISPGIHMVPRIHWSRVYLIVDKDLAIVDSGPPYNAEQVINYIRAIGRDPEELRYILMTHAHPDHAGNAPVLSARTGARVVCHTSEIKRFNNDEMWLCYHRALTGTRAPLPLLQRTIVSLTVNEGDTLPLLDGLKIVHTPGHTPGSVCYFLEARKLMFSGDTLFSDGARVSRSLPFPGYDGELYNSSLAKLSGMDFEGVFGGHGVPMLNGAAVALRRLLRTKPRAPSWSEYLAEVPKRIVRSKSLVGEHG